MNIRKELEALRDEQGDLADATAPSYGSINNPHAYMHDEIDALLNRIPEGHELRPREPNAEMRQIGGEVNCPTETLTSAMDYAEDVWRSMFDVYDEESK